MTTSPPGTPCPTFSLARPSGKGSTRSAPSFPTPPRPQGRNSRAFQRASCGRPPLASFGLFGSGEPVGEGPPSARAPARAKPGIFPPALAALTNLPGEASAEEDLWPPDASPGGRTGAFTAISRLISRQKQRSRRAQRAPRRPSGAELADGPPPPPETATAPLRAQRSYEQIGGYDRPTQVEKKGMTTSAHLC